MDFRFKSVKLYYYTILYWFLFLLLPQHSVGRYRQSVNRVYGNSLSWRLIEVQMTAWRCTVILNEKRESVPQLSLHWTVGNTANSRLGLRRVIWVEPGELCSSPSVAPCLCGGATCGEQMWIFELSRSYESYGLCSESAAVEKKNTLFLFLKCERFKKFFIPGKIKCHSSFLYPAVEENMIRRAQEGTKAYLLACFQSCLIFYSFTCILSTHGKINNNTNSRNWHRPELKEG
jgi:hypothetical protein